MTVSDVLMGSGPNNNEVDLIDIGALVLLTTFSPLLFGVYSWQIEVFGGYDFTAPIWTLSGVDISATLLVLVGSVGWILLTNFANGDTDIEGLEAGVVICSIALPILYVFIPAVESLVTWHDMMRLAAVLWVTIGSVYASYGG